MGNLFYFLGAGALGIFIGYSLKKRKKRKPRLQFTLIIDSIKIKSTTMAVTLSTIQEVTGQVTPTDKKGNAAKVQAGSVEYESSDDAVATVEEDASDETKFKIVAKGPGVAQVDISADADVGDGVVTISGFVAVEVLPAGATGFGITLGEPTDQP